MEKRLRLKRCNPCLSRQSQDEPPCIVFHPCDPEHVAKDMLFELSDNEDPPHDETNLKINQWMNAVQDPLAETPLCSIKQSPLQHRSLYITRNPHLKIRTQASQERHLQFSVIPHLKSHLRQLESPQKPPPKHQKEEKLQKPKKQDENWELSMVRTAAVTPKEGFRHKNASLYKKTKRNIFIYNFTEGKMRPSREKTCCEIQDMGSRVELIKEARRNRTLRKLLF